MQFFREIRVPVHALFGFVHTIAAALFFFYGSERWGWFAIACAVLSFGRALWLQSEHELCRKGTHDACNPDHLLADKRQVRGGNGAPGDGHARAGSERSSGSGRLREPGPVIPALPRAEGTPRESRSYVEGPLPALIETRWRKLAWRKSGFQDCGHCGCWFQARWGEIFCPEHRPGPLPSTFGRGS